MQDQLTLFPELSEDQSQATTFNKICEILECPVNTPGYPDVFGKKLSDYIEKNHISKIKTLSLFSGAGGLDIGFKELGFEIIEAIELEKDFCKTLELNNTRSSSTKICCTDIRDYTCDHLKNVEFIIGGPPCVTFSSAGRRANGVLGTTDERGTLFREYVRIVESLKPIGFLFENVYGIVGAEKGKAWEEILKSFSEIGYKLFYRILDAADYGVPQHRERLIIVGLKGQNFKFPKPTHGPDSIDQLDFYTAQEAVEGVFDLQKHQIKLVGGKWGYLLDNIPPGLNYSFYTEKMGHPQPVFAWRSKFSDFLYKADPERPVRTIKAQGGAYTGPLHWDNRFFVNDEYKRLQTFPDSYTFYGSEQKVIKQIGNSVPPQMARILALAIRQQVFKTQFPFQLPLLKESDVLTFRQRKRELTKLYQERAKKAIEILTSSAQKKEENSKKVNRKYSASIDSEFNFTIFENLEGKYWIEINWENNLEINISSVGKSTNTFVVELEISPLSYKWNLEVNQIFVKASIDDPAGFTIIWKCLEAELQKYALKADLVQLSGYYQYPSQIKIKGKLSRNFPFYQQIESILHGNMVAHLFPKKVFTSFWNMSSSEIEELFRFLRKLGYEVRNTNTNPQIEEDYWLIPYAFPTLKPRSVQTRKQIFKEENHEE